MYAARRKYRPITIVLTAILVILASCGGDDGTTNDETYVCDWIDRSLVLKAVGSNEFHSRGDLASALDDSLKISDCHVITEFGDKIITIKYTGFTEKFLTKSDSTHTQKRTRQNWKDGGPKIPDDKKKLVPLDGYVFGTAYPTDHYVRASVVTDHEFISVTIFNDADQMTVDLADDIARSITNHAADARIQHAAN